MVRSGLKRLASKLTFATFLLALPGLCFAQTLINGAGATFPYPIYSKWFNEYRKLHPDVQINYQSIGSGGGIKQVTEGTVDFGATDGPMSDAQLQEFQKTSGQNMTEALTYARLPKEVVTKEMKAISKVK